MEAGCTQRVSQTEMGVCEQGRRVQGKWENEKDEICERNIPPPRVVVATLFP